MSEPFHVYLDGCCEPEESFTHLDTAREFAASYGGDTEVMICEEDTDGSVYLVNDDGSRTLVEAGNE
jgi:hypothetical protein